MPTYLDKILYLYPDAQGVVYWHTKQDGTPWEDPYDGLVFENPNFPKPRKATLDALNDADVAETLSQRKEVARKQARDADNAKSYAVLAGLSQARQNRPSLALSEYLDELEDMEGIKWRF